MIKYKMLAFLSSCMSNSQSSIPLTSSNFVNHFIHYWYVCISIIMFVNTWPIDCSTLSTSTKNNILSSPTTIAYYQTLNFPIYICTILYCSLLVTSIVMIELYILESCQLQQKMMYLFSLMPNLLSNTQSSNMSAAGSIDNKLYLDMIN